MNVLVTGATGFLGLNIVEALLQAGHQVLTYIRPNARKSYLGIFPVKIVEGSLLDARSLRIAMEGVDAVIHTAGNTSTRWRDLPELAAVNLHGTKAVLEAVLAANVSRMVFTSSTATLESHAEQGEAEPVSVSGFRSNSPYARTKAAAEALLLDKPQCIVLCPAEVVGPYDHTLQWGRMILAVAGGKIPFIPPGGASFSPARDVALAHVSALTQGTSGRRYVLGGQNVSIARFLDLIQKEVGGSTAPACRLPYWFQIWIARIMESGWNWGGKGPALDSFRMRVFGSHNYFNDLYARQELGYNPRSLEAAIAEGHQWYQKHGFLPNASIAERPLDG